MDNLLITESYDKENITDSLGIRGVLLQELAGLKLNFPPAFIIDSSKFKILSSIDLGRVVASAIQYIESKMGKRFGGNSPLLFKVLISPSVDISSQEITSIHNVGLNKDTVTKYAEIINDENFAYSEFLHLLKTSAKLLDPQSETAQQEKKELSPKQACEAILADSDLFNADAHDFTAKIISAFHETYYADPTNQEVPCAVIIQAMVFGHTGESSYAGKFTTRNVVTGQDVIEGKISANSFNLSESNEISILDAPKKILDEVIASKKILERNFKNIMEVSFIYENEQFWILQQHVSARASLCSQLRLNLDMYKQNLITKSELIKFLKPEQLVNLLYPIIDRQSIGKIKTYQGGIAGSMGSAKGRLFTSTEKFMVALMEEKNTDKHDLILCMPATYATDVKAIELGKGVISSEGGYASHAPVVARSLGKPAIVIEDLEFHENGVSFPDGTFVKDGDVISFEVTKTEMPSIYFGSVELVYPNFQENGLYELMDIASSEIGNFHVRCNADNVREASIAKRFGASGIGLCRTEHMFFGKERLMNLIWLFYTEEREERKAPLEALKEFQKHDFLQIFNELQSNAVTIRLLDAPLHEFVPKDMSEIKKIRQFLLSKGVDVDEASMLAKFESLKETNPMLGHRGVRLAISYSDIYEMQTEAIVEAALESNQQNGFEPKVEIMVPFIMSDSEFKFIRNGRNIEGTIIPGINGVIEEIINKRKLEKLPFSIKIGVMIETPAAALNAGYLSQQADFFSFGTNDLTQMTHALSRDDINSFLPSYTQYDIFNNNPFEILTTPVKELIAIAKKLGKMFRPDIKLGLCGEHGASEKNIDFCIKTGLDYVSCSCYSVPIAVLSVVQNHLKNDEL